MVLSKYICDNLQSIQLTSPIQGPLARINSRYAARPMRDLTVCKRSETGSASLSLSLHTSSLSTQRRSRPLQYLEMNTPAPPRKSPLPPLPPSVHPSLPCLRPIGPESVRKRHRRSGAARRQRAAVSEPQRFTCQRGQRSIVLLRRLGRDQRRALGRYTHTHTHTHARTHARARAHTHTHHAVSLGRDRRRTPGRRDNRAREALRHGGRAKLTD
jgi:hypothetical protein